MSPRCVLSLDTTACRQLSQTTRDPLLISYRDSPIVKEPRRSNRQGSAYGRRHRADCRWRSRTRRGTAAPPHAPRPTPHARSFECWRQRVIGAAQPWHPTEQVMHVTRATLIGWFAGARLRPLHSPLHSPPFRRDLSPDSAGSGPSPEYPGNGQKHKNKASQIGDFAAASGDFIGRWQFRQPHGR